MIEISSIDLIAGILYIGAIITTLIGIHTEFSWRKEFNEWYHEETFLVALSPFIVSGIIVFIALSIQFAWLVIK